VTCFAGGDGTVSGNANVIPEYYEALWAAIQEKAMMETFEKLHYTEKVKRN